MRKIVIWSLGCVMSIGSRRYKKAADPERPAAPFASFIPRIVFSVIRAFQFMLPRSPRPFSVSEKYICRLSFVPNSRFT